DFLLCTAAAAAVHVHGQSGLSGFCFERLSLAFARGLVPTAKAPAPRAIRSRRGTGAIWQTLDSLTCGSPSFPLSWIAALAQKAPRREHLGAPPALIISQI